MKFLKVVVLPSWFIASLMCIGMGIIVSNPWMLYGGIVSSISSGINNILMNT